MPNKAIITTSACAAAITAICASFATQATAQSAPQCGERYTVQPGDSLSQIASVVYDDASAVQTAPPGALARRRPPSVAPPPALMQHRAWGPGAVMRARAGPSGAAAPRARRKHR